MRFVKLNREHRNVEKFSAKYRAAECDGYFPQDITIGWNFHVRD